MALIEIDILSVPTSFQLTIILPPSTITELSDTYTIIPTSDENATRREMTAGRRPLVVEQLALQLAVP
jgi:hypothetical protein